MIPLSETLGMLASFLISWSIMFVWLPSFFLKLDPDHSGKLDKLFVGLIHSTLFYMIAIHVLVGIRLLETISLIGVTVACLVVVARYHARSESISISAKLITALFDLTENREQWKIELRRLGRHLREVGREYWVDGKQALIRHPILIAAYTAVFGVALVDRFRYPFTHLSFASSDSYVHLGWSKYLSKMSIYLDGVYPFGFESTIAAIHEMFNLDMYEIVRFIGTLTSILMVLSLVFALRKMIGQDSLTILLTVFLLFFSSAMMMGNSVILWRQLSALSMEFAAVFILPGIAFLYQFFRTERTLYLVLAAECYAITAFTHPFAVVNLTFGMIAVGLAYWRKLLPGAVWWRIVRYMGAAGFIGILPPIIGLLSGKHFHGSSINYFEGEFVFGSFESPFRAIADFFLGQPLIVAMLALFVAYKLYRLIRRLGGRGNSADAEPGLEAMTAAAFMLAFMVFVYLTPQMGLPSLVPPDRQPIFVAMASALMFGNVFGFIVRKMAAFDRRKIVQALCVIAIMAGVALIPGQTMAFPRGDQHQYDEAIRGYLDIKKNFPVQNWNIISTVDELGIIYGYGYHTEIWQFVHDLNDPELKEVKFTTPYVFLFVEKKPIDIANKDSRPLTRADADKPFPVIQNGQLTEFYYGNVDNRRILEAKAYYWAEDYMRSHKDMTVFLETDNMKIYKIDQHKNEVILK